MTTINTSSLGTSSSVFPVGVKTDDSQNSDITSVSVNLHGDVFKTTNGADKAGSSEGLTPAEQAIKQLLEQIKETQKRLLEQQQQLSAAQNSKLPEPGKGQQVMAIQQQISGTMAQLASQQAALLELMKGTLKTTA
jgi:predicted ribosome quality control (RQC) complex YloA/Tae2 family protein